MTKKEEIIWMSAVELAKNIKSGKLSPVEVVDAFYNRIKKINPELNAFVTLTEESARKEAEAAEKAVKSGKKLGPLHGVPIAVKDNIDVKGVRLTYGSKMWEKHVAKEDMIHVARLREAGVIILGKTNLPEYGLIPVTDNPLFGPTKNPWDRTKTPGGSSGGSAVAVATGMCPIALGNDGGGSIRVPSSLCGVFGLKPHLGRIPRWPSLPGWETMAVEGPITRTVADAALMMDLMAGPDDRDYLSLPASGVSYFENLEKDAKNKKFAYSPDLGYAAVDPEVVDITRKAALSLADLGYKVEEVKLDFPNMETDLVNQVVSETVAANAEVLEEWKKVAYPVYLDFLWLADHIKGTDYVKTQYRRKDLWDAVRKVYEKYDFLLTPATAIPAFNLEIGMGPTEIDGKPVASTSWIAFTYPFNFTGQPASSVPCGFTKSKLPVGLQIVGNRFDELGVLQASRAFEKNFPWRDKKPPI
ncbi:MAG: amidase [Candidatus Jordarchaeum sp.]|uniref:amidase n=1 Tax=Candidatus Jordarchaeum sp. TaxID=2823881 RepID=UPI0040490F48